MTSRTWLESFRCPRGENRNIIKADDKRNAIVRAAFDVLQQQGLQALSFSVVAERSGLSRQLVRYYYPDLDALMVGVCDYLADLYRTSLINGVSGLDRANRLDFFLDFYFDLLDSPRKPRDDKAYDACFAYAAGSEGVRDNLRTQYGLLGQVLSHEIELRYPGMTTAEALALSYLFVCLMYGHWKMVATLGHDQNHKHITRDAMSRLLASYEAQPADGRWSMRPWSVGP